MSHITRVGVDLAKNVIQVHAVDATGKVITARALSREKFLLWCVDLPAGCVVAMEACGGAHHWCRKLRERGLDARMIPAHFVTPYRIQGKSGKERRKRRGSSLRGSFASPYELCDSEDAGSTRDALRASRS